LSYGYSTNSKGGPFTVARLAERLDANRGWISVIVTDFEEQHLVEKRQRVKLTNIYKTRLLLDLFDAYDPEAILLGKKEEILQTLQTEPKTVAELELAGFATSTVYQALNDLRITGVVEKLDNGAYRITDDRTGKLNSYERVDD
jgi:Mn-dependent DtxR family transcriptional regulator